MCFADKLCSSFVQYFGGKVRFFRYFFVIVFVFASFGFSWLEQGKKTSPQQEKNDAVNKNELASAELITGPVRESKTDNLKQISSDLAGSSEIIKPVLPKGFSSNSRYSYSGIREMTSAIQAATNAQALNNSGVVKQVATLKDSPFLGKDPQIVRIQKQINQVIKAYDQFKSLDVDQLDALETVVQEVSAQREVLDKIAEQMDDEKLTKQDSEKILEQEKIRRQNR